MATEIHPTAIIKSGAKIGEGCQIGAYAIVGKDVKLGAGTILHDHTIIDGLTTIGENCEIYSFACIGKQTQDLKYDGETTYVKIGNNTTLREYVTVHCATIDGATTVIGNNCNLLAYVHIAHDCIVGDNVIMSNLTQLGGHVIVGENAIIGGMCGIHQFVKIGRNVMVSATSKVVQDLLPFTLADGAPAASVMINKIGMQRHNYSKDEISATNRAYKTIFRKNLTLEQAAEALQEDAQNYSAVAIIVEFALSAERGLARPKKK